MTTVNENGAKIAIHGNKINNDKFICICYDIPTSFSICKAECIIQEAPKTWTFIPLHYISVVDFYYKDSVWFAESFCKDDKELKEVKDFIKFVLIEIGKKMNVNKTKQNLASSLLG
jgi:hypothetical protein